MEWYQPEVRQAARHCRHCMGDCPGDCVLSDGHCIHGWNGKRPAHFTWRLVLTGPWWHRMFWGH